MFMYVFNNYNNLFIAVQYHFLFIMVFSNKKMYNDYIFVRLYS